MIGGTCASATKSQNSSEYLYVSQAHQGSLWNEETILSAGYILEVIHLFFGAQIICSFPNCVEKCMFCLFYMCGKQLSHVVLWGVFDMTN